VSKSLY